MAVVLATGQGATAPPLSPRPLDLPLQMTWTGPDGSVWDLTSGVSGVALQAGVRGLTLPKVTRFTSVSPAVAGSRWRGNRTEEREVFWPMAVWTDPGQPWLDLDSAWWYALHPSYIGTWSVKQINGTSRTLDLRAVDDGQHAYQIDPSLTGWTVYGITLIAEQPFWQGPTISRTFRPAAGATNFFSGFGSVLTISAITDSSFTNPGDVEAWPVWRIDGPFTSVTVGVAGRLIEVPFALGAGQWLTVDTAPTAQTAFDQDGNERTGDLGQTDYAPIGPGESQPLSLSVLGGTGTVTATLAPSYYRAW